MANLFANMGKVPSAALPNEKDMQQSPDDQTPWWLRYGARMVGTIASLIAIGMGAQLGIVSIITFSPLCLFAAILQVGGGFFVALVEAPCFCAFLDFAQVPGAFFERKPAWYKAAIYAALGILPVIFCVGITTIFGGGLVLVCGILYGIIAMGKKASAEQMRNAAGAGGGMVGSPGGDIEQGGGFSPTRH